MPYVTNKIKSVEEISIFAFVIRKKKLHLTGT